VGIENKPGSSPTYCRKREEYLADFCLVSRRHLSAEEFQLLTAHFIHGKERAACMRKLRMDRGTFAHAVYRVQQKCGRAFAEVEPYPLYPLGSYFSSEAGSPRMFHNAPTFAGSHL